MGGRAPSCSGETCPPGKTWAEAKERDVVTRWRRRMRLVGLMSRTEALGEGGEGDELGFGSAFDWEPGDAVDVKEVEEEEEDEDGPRMLRARRLGAMVGRSGIVR